jgi:hypothetical protein
MTSRLIITGLIICQLIAGCSTLSSGGNAELMPGEVDTYTFTLNRKSFTTARSSDKQFEQQIQVIMDEFGYLDYRVLEVIADSITAKDTYIVKFYK